MDINQQIIALLTRIAGNQEKPHGLGASLQQQRSSLASPRYNVGQTVGNEPLTVDIPVAPKPGEHWIMDSIEAHGVITVAIPPAGQLLSPASGLFLVPQNTPAETLAEAAAGVTLDKRRICLPILASIVPLPVGWAFSIFYNGVPGKTIPAGWTVRLIISPNPGAAAPGPGALSSAELIAIVTPEQDLGVIAG